MLFFFLSIALGNDALLLSRIAVSESGFYSTDDHKGIYATLERRRFRLSRRLGPLTFEQTARMYSPMSTGAEAPTGRHAWITELDEYGNAPPSWNQTVPWSYYRSRWLRMLDMSRALVRGDVEPRCSADHWSNESIARSAESRGLVRVNCGRTVNVFWRIAR